MDSKKRKMSNEANHHTISAIAGYCCELTLWKLLRDVLALLPEPLAISADNIIINCDTDESLSLAPDVPACSESETVRRIGALVSFLSSGRQPFGGRGADYINLRRHAELPSLRREHSSLNILVHSCLAHDPAKRPSLAELAKMAEEGLSQAIIRVSQRQSDVNTALNHLSPDHSAWPEKMRP